MTNFGGLCYMVKQQKGESMENSCNNFRLDKIKENAVYELFSNYYYDSGGKLSSSDVIKEIITDRVFCNEGRALAVPVRLINRFGQEKMALAPFNQFTQRIVPDFLSEFDADGNLKGLDFSGEDKDWNGSIIQEILLPEWYDEELAKAYPNMPDYIKLDDFCPADIPAKIGYIVTGDINPEMALDEEFIDAELDDLEAEFIDDEDRNFQDTESSECILYLIHLRGLPDQWPRCLLPVEITFNEKQVRRGYVYYDSVENDLLDIYIFDKNIGRISIINDSDKLEDCGLFKDESKFSYKILLSNI